MKCSTLLLVWVAYCYYPLPLGLVILSLRSFSHSLFLDSSALIHTYHHCCHLLVTSGMITLYRLILTTLYWPGSTHEYSWIHSPSLWSLTDKHITCRFFSSLTISYTMLPRFSCISGYLINNSLCCQSHARWTKLYNVQNNHDVRMHQTKHQMHYYYLTNYDVVKYNYYYIKQCLFG